MNVASWWPKNGTGAGKRPGVYGLRILDPSDGAVRGVIRDWNFGELLFGRRVDQRTLRVSEAATKRSTAALNGLFLSGLSRPVNASRFFLYFFSI